MDQEFYGLLADRVKELGFCDARLEASINNVIDECIYPKPTIAQFTKYNKLGRLFTYDEMTKKVHEANGMNIFKYYNKHKIDGVVYWVKKEI